MEFIKYLKIGEGFSMELLNSKFRTFTGVNIQAQFAVGYVILGFLRAVDQIE